MLLFILGLYFGGMLSYATQIIRAIKQIPAEEKPSQLAMVYVIAEQLLLWPYFVLIKDNAQP